MPIVIEPFHSRLLEDNPLGDTPDRRVPVYLPAEAAAHPERRYPVLFGLAGFTGTGESFLNYDFYQPNLPQLLDAMIASGELPPCVVVLVDAMTALGGNQYLDSPAVGPWRSHIVEELIPWAEARFPVRPGPAHRGVFGKSSGGYGALMMGLEMGDHFGGVVSHAGDAYFEYCYGVDLPAAADVLLNAGGLEGWFSTWRTHARLPSRLFPAVNIVAMSAFYSPNPAAPFGFDLPFDPDTGELRPEVFARWKRRDPVACVPACQSSLRGLRFFFFDCGDRDEYHLHHGARILHLRCEAAAVPHVYERFDDGHRSIGYRYRASLPRLVRALG
jgi:enterochelin esterase family protein